MQQSSRQSGMRINDIFKQLQAHCQLAFSDQRVSLHHKIDQWFSKWLDFRFERIPPENQSRRIFSDRNRVVSIRQNPRLRSWNLWLLHRRKKCGISTSKANRRQSTVFPRDLTPHWFHFGQVRQHQGQRFSWITTIAEKTLVCIKQCQRHDAESNITL